MCPNQCVNATLLSERGLLFCYCLSLVNAVRVHHQFLRVFFRKGVILLANNFFLSQGAFGKEMSRWVTKEVKGRHFDSNRKCALGLEVDFRGGKGCDVRSKSKNVKKRIRRLFGFNIKASIRLRLKGLVFRVPRVNYTSFLQLYFKPCSME